MLRGSCHLRGQALGMRAFTSSPVSFLPLPSVFPTSLVGGTAVGVSGELVSVSGVGFMGRGGKM